MRHIAPAVLHLAALIHMLPPASVLRASKLASLYGFPVHDPNLEISLRHRAVLFGFLTAMVGSYNTAISTVVKADIVALVLLVVAAAVHLRGAGHG